MTLRNVASSAGLNFCFCPLAHLARSSTPTILTRVVLDSWPHSLAQLATKNDPKDDQEIL
ncbi:hypothetical protein WG66_013630 [Moniliophthora roreri]|nr:hypothetical protein WG66_013630 [Moniliophthora roreri]